MKLSPILLLLTHSIIAKAWTTSVTPKNKITSRNISLMASRATQKKKSRTAWSESRGAGDDESSSSSQFCTIVGGGRIGSLLAKGGPNLLLKRGDAIPPDDSGPIFIATRNDSLDSIVENCPSNRRKDLVFLQNGYLERFLKEKGLEANTQALLFVSVTSMDATPIDGITSTNPDGLTAATGEHAQALADRLSRLDLKCHVLAAEKYQPAMFEKLIWICTYMLVGTAKECGSVGEAQSEHSDLVTAVVTELMAATSKEEGIAFEDGAVERLASYTDVVTDFPAAVKEFEWRNKYFYDLGDEACPTHNALLRECQEKGLLGFDL